MITNTVIQFPKDRAMMSSSDITPVIENNAMLRIAGHVVSTKESRSTVPMKTPSTSIPTEERGDTGGIIARNPMTAKLNRVFVPVLLGIFGTLPFKIGFVTDFFVTNVFIIEIPFCLHLRHGNAILCKIPNSLFVIIV